MIRFISLTIEWRYNEDVMCKTMLNVFIQCDLLKIWKQEPRRGKMIIDEKTENNNQSQGDDIMDMPGISRKNDHITP